MALGKPSSLINSASLRESVTMTASVVKREMAGGAYEMHRLCTDCRKTKLRKLSVPMVPGEKPHTQISNSHQAKFGLCD